MTEKSPTKSSSAKQVLARNVRAARKHAHISQRKLAELSGLSQPHISQIEQALLSVGIDYVELLGQALGVTVSDLFNPLLFVNHSTGEEFKDDDSGEITAHKAMMDI